MYGLHKIMFLSKPVDVTDNSNKTLAYIGIVQYRTIWIHNVL